MNNNRGRGFKREREGGGGVIQFLPLKRRGLLERVACEQDLHLGDIVNFARPNGRACSKARISRLPFALNAMLNLSNKELEKAVNEYPSALPGKGP